MPVASLLLPGFNDAHVHFVSGGLQLDAVQLNDATSSGVNSSAESASRRRKRRKENGFKEAIGMRRNGARPTCRRKS